MIFHLRTPDAVLRYTALFWLFDAVTDRPVEQAAACPNRTRWDSTAQLFRAHPTAHRWIDELSEEVKQEGTENTEMSQQVRSVFSVPLCLVTAHRSAKYRRFTEDDLIGPRAYHQWSDRAPTGEIERATSISPRSSNVPSHLCSCSCSSSCSSSCSCSCSAKRCSSSNAGRKRWKPRKLGVPRSGEIRPRRSHVPITSTSTVAARLSTSTIARRQNG